MNVRSIAAGMVATVGMALVASPLAVAATSAGSASGLDNVWIQQAQQGDRFEVAAAKVALRKSTDPSVRILAMRMVKDHSASLKTDTAIARRVGAKVELHPTSSQTWEIQMIARLSGASFDYQYALLETRDHMDDQQGAKDEIGMGSNTLVRRDARTSLVMYRLHGRLAKATLKLVMPS